MSKTNYRAKMLDDILESPKATIIFGVITILFGLLFAFVITGNTDPVSRNDALAYEGEFEKYREGKNWSTIYFTDGTEYDLYPHTLSGEVVEQLEALPKGTRLYLAVNPNTSYVAEIRTEDGEILNFETTQKEIDDYQIGYVIIGVVVALGGVFLIWYACVTMRHEKEQEKKKQKRIVPQKLLFAPPRGGRASCWKCKKGSTASATAAASAQTSLSSTVRYGMNTRLLLSFRIASVPLLTATKSRQGAVTTVIATSLLTAVG